MENSLIGKLVGGHPNIDSIRSWAGAKWKRMRHMDVIALPNGFFQFSFNNSEDP